MRALIDGLQRKCDLAVIMKGLRQGRAGCHELFQIAAGGKGICAGAAQDDAANAAVDGKFGPNSEEK